MPSPQRTAPPESYACPEYSLETLESCEQLGGSRAFRLVAELKLCTRCAPPTAPPAPRPNATPAHPVCRATGGATGTAADS